MSTGSMTLPEDGRPEPAARRRWAPRLHDARIRSKLALILVLPLTAVLALATVRLVDVGSRARDANQIEDLAELSTDISAVTQSVHRERMAAARYLTAPARSAAANTAQDAYNTQVAQTDALITAYNGDRRGLDERVQVEPQGQLDAIEQPTEVEARLDRIDDHLRTMDATRRKVLARDQIAVAEVVLRYGVVITDLLGFGETLGQFAGDSGVADRLRAIAAFARAKAGAAEQEAVAFAARSAGDLNEEEYAAFVATQTGQQEALLAFSLAADPEQRALVDSTVTGDAVTLADKVSAELSRSVGATSAITAQDAALAIGAVVDLMRWAELRLETRLVDAARAENSSVTRQAIIEAVLILLTLVVAIVLAVVLARSLNLSLRRLREGALSVANRDLPEAVARLRDVRNLGDGGADDIVRQLRDPIQLGNADEIGQVAEAFNVVHREAVRIAAEQAALRTSVSAMFLNLARRSQSLVDRMIGELDQIERGEEDPKRLAQLFELDHLATRMRRNDENLLVLAGADSSTPRREDALLVDALRAAQSEVELYNRIEFGTIDTDVYVSALAVNDVVRLIAELLDNATRFSSPETVVVADGRRIRDYVVIQIEDRGLGMSEEQMEGLNRRLAQPPDVDVAAFRLMGLAVVGRLASRYGIRVELRANIEGGTVAQVILPSAIVVLPRTGEPPARPQSSVQHSESSAARGWGDAGPSHRATTATLPAVSGDPWQPRAEPTGDRLVPAGSRPQHAFPPPAVTSPRGTAPAAGTPAGPAVPGFAEPPTPGRPALPARAHRHAAGGRTAQPVEAATSGSSGTNPFGAGSFGASSAGTGPFRAGSFGGGPAVAESAGAGPSAPGAEAPAAGRPGPVESGPVESGPVESGPVMSGPVASGPVVSGPVVSGPVVSGPVVSGAIVPARSATDAVVGAPTMAYPTLRASANGATGNAVSIRQATPHPGWGAALAAMPPVPPPPTAPAPAEDRAEAPIFREMEASWFRGADQPQQEWSLPTAGYAPPPVPAALSTPAAGASPVRPAAVPYLSPMPVGAVSGGARRTDASADSAPGRTGPDAPGPDGPTPGGPASDIHAAGVPAPDEPGPDEPGPDEPGPDEPGPGEPAWGDRTAGGDAGSAGAARKDAVDQPDRDDASRRDSGQNGGAPTGRSAGDDTGGQQTIPRPRPSAEEAWRTAADEGWHRATAAAAPPDAGKTRSGLPKRVPQAQLVPGGVQSGPRDATRRTPDEVRGLLSAYHRGVQRGRTAGSADAVVTAPAPKENEQ